MKTENFIPINQLSLHYKVELSFINDLSEMGLIEINIIEQSQFIHIDKIKTLEKIIRIHHELDINIEGIDVVFNLLQKIDTLQNELNSSKNRLSLVVNEFEV